MSSFGEKKAKEQLEKLDPNNPDDKAQIDLINEGLKSSDAVFSQIDRVDKNGNEISIVPTGEEIVIEATVDITIKRENKITIEKASKDGVELTMEGISTVAGKVKRATITPKGYSVKVGWLPEISGEF